MLSLRLGLPRLCAHSIFPIVVAVDGAGEPEVAENQLVVVQGVLGLAVVHAAVHVEEELAHHGPSGAPDPLTSARAPSGRSSRLVRQL